MVRETTSTLRQPGSSSGGGASQHPRPKQDAVEEQYYDSEPLGVIILLLFCPQEYFENIFTQIQKVLTLPAYSRIKESRNFKKILIKKTGDFSQKGSPPKM